MSIRILLADDHGIIRQGLCSLLEKQPDMEVVGEAEDGQKALELVRQLVPDVVIMDITMPNLNGVGATSQITSEFPGVKVLALSIHSNKRFVADMLKAGASGYILKECLFDELIEAVRTITAGNIYFSPRITDVVVDDYVNHLSEGGAKPPKPLTARERQVLQCIAEGRSIREIAEIMYLSIKTVEFNRRQIMKKLKIKSVAELTKYAIREGLTSLEQ
jgi:DNA-binding NarL/FixJ family response regulator